MSFRKLQASALCLVTIIVINLDAAEKRWWDIFLTSPDKPDIRRNNPLIGLTRTMQEAKKTLFGAFFDISSLEIADELISLKKKGIDVRIVIERDNVDKEAASRLIMAGIPVVTDTKPGLMHNKFMIIDESIVWTGSYNLTDNCTYKNNNNAIKIYSPELARIYISEFMEMFQDNIFANKKDLTPFPSLMNKYYVKIDQTDINVYFSPENNIERILLKRIEKAKETIHFMAFSFTSGPISDAMIQKNHDGVTVYGLFEKRGTKDKYSQFVKMKLEGVPVRLDRNKHIMHHKVIIIDKRILITGSFNFSKNANKRNDENIIIIDNPEIASYYLEEFYRLYR